MPIKPPTGRHLEPWRSVVALCDVLNAGAKHPTFTVSAMRNLMAQRKRNGLEKFTRKVGGKLIISEQGFFWWLSTAGGSDHESAG